MLAANVLVLFTYCGQFQISFKVSSALKRKSDKSCARLSLAKIIVGNYDNVQSRLVLFKIVK